MSAREIALDTNVFLLFLVGMRDASSIAKNKRLEAYDEEAFERLRNLVSAFDRIVVTPGCLSEVTNLLDFDKSSRKENYGHLARMLNTAGVLDERYVAAIDAVKNPCYRWLGITDATYVEIAKRGIPVVTADFQLFQQVICYAADSVNFGALAFN